MKPSTLLALAPFLASAVARPQPVEKQPTRFDVVAVSEGPVQYRPLAVSSSFFYLGKGAEFTDSYCPPNIEKAGRCPPGKDTVLKDAHTLVKHYFAFLQSIDGSLIFAIRTLLPLSRSSTSMLTTLLEPLAPIRVI